MPWFPISYVALWIIVLLQLVLSLVIFRQLGIMVLGLSRTVEDSGIPEGKRLPSLQLVDIGSNSWSFEQVKGRRALIVIISTHCASCNALLPALRTIEQQGTVQLATLVLFGQDTARVRTYATRNRVPGTVVLLSDADAEALDVEVTPYAYLVDEHGVVIRKGVPSRDSIRQFADHTADARIVSTVARPRAI